MVVGLDSPTGNSGLACAVQVRCYRLAPPCNYDARFCSPWPWPGLALQRLPRLQVMLLVP